MILIDFSQVLMANIFVGMNQGEELSLSMIRHMTLNTIRKLKKKFGNEYGEIIICVDSGPSWRYSVFPYYKASRAVAKEESSLDWEELYGWISTVREEIEEVFPYKVIRVPNCEADDIIGTLCELKGKEFVMGEGTEKILIVSSDKDFIQLHRYVNVKQYANQRDEWVTHSDPHEYKKLHIYKGDSGDGIPNIMSADDALVMKVRQSPITKKRIEKFDAGELDENEKRNLARNKLLIDLSNTPQKLKNAIIEKFDEPNTKGRSKLLNYFIKNRLKLLLEDIQDF